MRIYVEDAANVPPEIPEDIAGVRGLIIERQIEPCALPDVARYDDRMAATVAQPLRQPVPSAPS